MCVRIKALIDYKCNHRLSPPATMSREAHSCDRELVEWRKEQTTSPPRRNRLHSLLFWLVWEGAEGFYRIPQ
jgi:hypothetical protein